MALALLAATSLSVRNSKTLLPVDGIEVDCKVRKLAHVFAPKLQLYVQTGLSIASRLVKGSYIIAFAWLQKQLFHLLVLAC